MLLPDARNAEITHFPASLLGISPARADELPELAEAFAAAYLDNLLQIPMPRDEAEVLADIGLRQPMLKAAEWPDLLVPVAEDTEHGVIAAALAIYMNRTLKSATGLYMWVREEYRGRALFTRRMFRETEKVLAANGMKRVEFGVLTSNGRAEGIYRALGYSTTAITMVKRLD